MVKVVSSSPCSVEDEDSLPPAFSLSEVVPRPYFRVALVLAWFGALVVVVEVVGFLAGGALVGFLFVVVVGFFLLVLDCVGALVCRLGRLFSSSSSSSRWVVSNAVASSSSSDDMSNSVRLGRGCGLCVRLGRRARKLAVDKLAVCFLLA